jgi:hypothetical protein
MRPAKSKLYWKWGANLFILARARELLVRHPFEWPWFNRPRILKHRAHIKFSAGLAVGASAFRVARRRFTLMVNCPKCGAEVREEKAFCHNCGSPMNAAMRQREEPQPDFGAAQQPFVPPAITEVQQAVSENLPVAAPQPAALPLPSGAQPGGGRRPSRKIGFGFVLLLLFLMFIVFVIALWLD